MSKPEIGKSNRAHQSEQSEGERFASLLDNLLKVPRSELEEALEKERAAKKVKVAVSVRAGNARQR